jgi:hypothetical protein
MPSKYPDSVVSGVLISPWASNQTIAAGLPMPASEPRQA